MTKFWPMIFLSFAAGIALANYRAWPLILFITLLCLLVSFGLKEYRTRILICLALIGGGYLYCHVMAYKPPIEMPIVKDAEINGHVDGFPFYDGQKTSFILNTNNTSPYEKKIRVVCLFESNLKRGDQVRIRGDMKPPRKPGNPGEFDYPAYLAHQGVYYNLTAMKPSAVSLISHQSGILQWVDRFRYQGERLTKQILPQRESAVLLGMLLGSREGMDEQEYSDFQKTGIVHLFSVSGLHVGFVLLLVAWLLSFTPLSKLTRFLVGIIVLMVYGSMVAWPAPVIRAVLMSSLGLLAYYSGRENSLLNALAISGLVILLVDPDALFSLSFQLTFLATWGLVYLFPILVDHFPYKSWAIDLILIPLSAELAVLPLIAYNFNLFTPSSILSNILVTYLSGGVVILGFIAFLLAPLIPSLASLVLYPAGMFIEGILYIVEAVKNIPGAYWWVATPAIGMIWLYYLALFGAIIALRSPEQRRYYLISGGCLLVFILSLLIPAGWYNRGRLELVFMDVGQGDCILMKSPQGKYLMVDGGGSQFYDVGGKTVLPYLHRQGIRRLDMIINTHPDLDHLGGVESVADEIKTGYLGLPESIIESKEYHKLMKIAKSRNIPVVPLRTGQYINLENELKIRVLHPDGQRYEGNQFNQESVVLEIRFRNFSSLLCGDIPAETMSDILKETEKPVTLVKVPHHGSKGSLVPGFYKDLKPSYAVISVAENNPFGHPSPAVLQMLANQGIRVFRTDRNGAVTVSTDGQQINVETVNF